MNELPLPLSDLLNAQGVESHRLEYKASWSEQTANQVVRTVCAFANDILNLNGGYLLLGVEEQEGRPRLPPAGLGDADLDLLQKKIYGACARIDPPYQPAIYPVITEEGARLLVLRCPGGDTRPYLAPEQLEVKGSARLHWVRQGSQTVRATGELQRQLLELTARVPFDDRRHPTARVEDLSLSLVRRFLADVGSDLARQDVPDADLLRQLDLVSRPNGHDVPKNVALLFFSEDPDRYFRGARVEVVHFGQEGDLLREWVLRGPLPSVIRATLDHLEGLTGSFTRKLHGRPEAERIVPWPHAALREALVNAVLHRGYDGPPEPVKVYLYPDRMEITSYPGPVSGLRAEDLEPGAPSPSVPARNRRIGELLKELRLAEARGTGIPKIRRQMRENGSPAPRFDFDADRTWFRTTLPAHPEILALNALQEASYQWATGDRRGAFETLLRATAAHPESEALQRQAISYAGDLGEVERAWEIYTRYKASGLPRGAGPALDLARVLLAHGEEARARAVLSGLPNPADDEQALEGAILLKRSGNLEAAHQQLQALSGRRRDDPRFLEEFAQTKQLLARQARGPGVQALRRRLHQEASDLLRRAVDLHPEPARLAWCLHDLAWSQSHLGAPYDEVRALFLRALDLARDNPALERSYESWRTARR